MPAQENMGDKRPTNKPGLYRNPDGLEILTTSGEKGRIQADAIVQQGYVWVSEKPETKAVVDTPKK